MFLDVFRCLPAEPAFHSRDPNPTTQLNRLELGVSFSSGLQGGSCHVFSSDLLRISVVPHKCVSDFREAVGARDVIFGRPWGPGWAMLRNPNLIKIFSGTAQICLGFSRGGRGSGCHFRPAVGTRLGYVKESEFVYDFNGIAHICIGFSPGGRGSGCHFRPAAGTRLGVVQESGFIEDFS